MKVSINEYTGERNFIYYHVPCKIGQQAGFMYSPCEDLIGTVCCIMVQLGNRKVRR